MPGSKNVFIVAAKRTAFGSFGGKLKGQTATDMGAVAAAAALKAGNVNPETVSSVIMGNVAQTATDAAYIARHVGLRTGVPESSTALTVNRLCGSGFQSIISGIHEIVLEGAEVVVAGGAENMSQAPYSVRGDKSRFGTTLGAPLQLEDSLWAALTDSHIKTPMAITAENLAEKYHISREECDEFALSSQERWAKAQEQGVFEEEVCDYEVKGRKGKENFRVDEHPRKTSMEQLGKLGAVFKKDGVVSAGNASGICDGAGALVLASEDAVNQHGLTPLARVVSWGVSGVDPNIMGIGPVTAIQQALKRASLELGDMSHIEVNEAFAAQVLAVRKELGLVDSAAVEKTNPHGGAIALGHPLAASGSRIMSHLVHSLKGNGHRYGVGSACIGGGQGIAIILESTAKTAPSP